MAQDFGEWGWGRYGGDEEVGGDREENTVGSVKLLFPLLLIPLISCLKMNSRGILPTTVANYAVDKLKMEIAGNSIYILLTYALERTTPEV
ncbi:hypothetical protein [Nostoc sp. MS1]|uniref:hypothetical protein n=1 Tax=Nostoc sp. MS1 TaxID=2764711 RepID=UPI001CC37E9E|nr:hypothetical protein [Nostoc sp. MS1]